MNHRLRNALLGAVTVAVALAVSVALSEGILRLIHFEYDYTLRIVNVGEEWRDLHMFGQDMFESDPVLLWKPRSSTNYDVPFNSYGYRGREVAAAKDSKELRILAVGDSNTLGPAEYSWPGFLQDRFDVSCPDSRATVLNAGVYGYTSFQGIRRFEEGLKYAPDIVLIAFGWNDAVETTNLPDKTYGDQSLRFAAIKRFLARNSKIYQLLHSASDRFLRDSVSETDIGRMTPRVSLTDYRSNLIKLVSRAVKKGILPVLLTRPNIVDTAAHFTEVQAWRRNLSQYNAIVREVAAEFHVPLVDAYNTFAGVPAYFIDQNHLAKSGARRLADKVYSEINLKMDKCPDETFDDDYLSETVDSHTIFLKAAPLDVVAGRDSYDLWIDGEKFASAWMRYRFNGGEIREFEVALDSGGKASFFVSSATPKGAYRYIAFRPSGYDYYVRSDITITVR